MRRTTSSATSARKKRWKASRKICAAPIQARRRSSVRCIPPTIRTRSSQDKTYDYTVEVQGIKEKKLPELNDEFAKDAAGEAAGVTTLAELRDKIRENLEAAKDQQQAAQAREKILEAACEGCTTSLFPKRWWKARWMCAWSVWCARWRHREWIPGR